MENTYLGLTAETLQALLNKLNAQANELHCYDKWGEDYCPGGNGNYDDAWGDGDDHGRTEYARELLALLGQPYQPKAQKEDG